MPVRYVNVGDMSIDATPQPYIDPETGEIGVSYDDDGTVLKDMILLIDSNGLPISAANEYLINRKSCAPDSSISSLAKGLMHFFDYCEEQNIEWDSTPRIQSERPLYKFTAYLQELHDTIVDPATNKRLLASTTANTYKGAAVNLVRFWLEKDHHFTHPPCRFYKTKVENRGMLAHIQNKIKVDTTDLKIIAHDQDTSSKIPNHRRPLLKTEKDALLKAIQDGLGLEKRDSQLHTVKLPQPFKMMSVLSLTTGIRKEEATTFSSTLVVMPKPDSNESTVKVDIDPSVGCHTKGGSSRQIAVPNEVMKQLFIYKNSAEYQTRLEKYKERNKGNKRALRYPPLFLKANGTRYSEGYINSRWVEVRNMINYRNPDLAFTHKFHNLRATFATDLTVALLKVKYPEDHPDHPNEYRFSRSQVEQLVQTRLGHSDPQTTRLYVEFLDEQNLVRNADVAYEKHLDELLGVNDGACVEEELIGLLKAA